MQRGEFVRAQRNIDYGGEHGTIKKGEMGIIAGLTEDGAYDVKWLNKHRRMVDWRNRTAVDRNDVELIPAPLILARTQAAVGGLILLAVAFLVVVPPLLGHHWLFNFGSRRAAQRVFLTHAPAYSTYVVEEGGQPWCITYERIKGVHVREVMRRALTPEQVEPELRRLNAL
jgi:hypothetical protein